MRSVMKIMMALCLMGAFSVMLSAEEVTKAEQEIRLFLDQQLKTGDDAAKNAYMNQIRNRIRMGEEIHAGLMKESFRQAYAQSGSVEDSAAVSLEAQEQYQKMRKYGYSKRESSAQCLQGVQEGLQKNRKQERKQMKGQVKESLEEKVQKRLRTRSRNHQEEASSEEGKQLRQQKRLRKGKH